MSGITTENGRKNSMIQNSKNYYINTFGCQMNVHESEKLAGILRERGYSEAAEQKTADFIVFNTCCIRETAEHRALGNIGAIKKLKVARPGLKIAVCGCMAQKEGMAETLKKRYPYVDLVFGTHNLYKFGEYLDTLEHQKRVYDIWEKENGLPGDVPIYRTSGVNAWLNIMYGCDNFCSYCIVPYVRGRERSRPFDSIMSDINCLITQGFKEITLLGQNVNSYYDKDADVDFAGLLRAAAMREGDFRIKFMTSHPKDLSRQVIETIAEFPRLAKSIHLPIQAGSDKVLKSMNRKYTSQEYLEKVNLIRELMPQAGITTDIMVGFPNETEDDFEKTLEIAETVRYNNIYTFVYSRRSGTPADLMEQVPENVKKERIKRLIALQDKIGTQLAKECVGKTYRVLCDEFSDGKCGGKSDCGKAVTFASPVSRVGEFLDVEITGSRKSKLIGRVIS